MKKNIKWTYIIIGIISFLIFILIYINWSWFIYIPKNIINYSFWSTFFWLTWIWIGLYKFFYVIELKNEHKNHFDFISNICEQNKININRGIFTSIEEAEEEYEKYKKGFIIPYWYKYSVTEWEITESFFNNISSIELFERKVLDNDNNIYREFIDLVDFRKKLLQSEITKIEISSNWYNNILEESFILPNSLIDELKSNFVENQSIVILKWYLFINILKND